MSALVTTIVEGLRYRGREGHWAWILHRVSGLGVVLFLLLHVPGMATAAFAPEIHERMLETYRSPLFAVLELGLAACLVYHAINGTRIALLELKPEWWSKQGEAMKWSMIITGVFLLPTLVIMGAKSVSHFFGG